MVKEENKMKFNEAFKINFDYTSYPKPFEHGTYNSFYFLLIYPHQLRKFNLKKYMKMIKNTK